LNCFVGIDLGTSGCRGVAIDAQARVVAEGTVTLAAPESPVPGYSQQDPQLWWQAVIQVLKQLGQSCQGRKAQAIAVDGTSASLLLTNEQGEPLTPGLMYSDSRSLDTLPLLEAIAPQGSPVHSASSSLAKLLHLRSQIDPQPFYALHQADWILGRLCDRYPISDENNALKLGYDPILRQWPAWMQALALPEGCLPVVYPSGTPVGRLSPRLAAETGLDRQTIIVTGTTDSTAAFLATGAAEIGDAVTSLGSTLVLKILSTRPVFASEYGVYSHRLGDRWLVGGASNTGGAVCRAFFSDEEMARLSESIDIARPTGLDYYPLLRAGERFPINDPSLAPRLSPRPDDDTHFLQGILEGLTRIEQEGYALLHQLGAEKAHRVLSIGGGAINEAWRRMRENALGVPVLRAEQQAPAYGAALLARKGAFEF
jgi:D-ribulokinase